MSIKKTLEIFKIGKEERLPAAIAFVLLLVLHTIMFCAYWYCCKDYCAADIKAILKSFCISGFDPITYQTVTDWGVRYNVYRHPLLAFFVWPLFLVNQGLTALFGVNLMQIAVSLPWIVSGVYSFVFLNRIFREIVQIERRDSLLLSAMCFSFAYVLVSLTVPDHFGISMMLLLMSIYIAGKLMQEGRQMGIWQTVALFTLTAGVTLSNGVKTFIYALFVNKRRFFRPRYLVAAVLLPSALIWGLARWEYRQFVWPHEMARKQLRQQKDQQYKQRQLAAFKDTTTLTDSTAIAAAFKKKMTEAAKRKYVRDHKQPWNKHAGKPIAKGEFMNWTDISTSRIESLYENVFGESLILHQDYLLKDTLRSRPVILHYRWWWNYLAEGMIVLLFLLGVWCGRRSAFMWMCVAGMMFDVALHLGLGFGLNEVYIMTAHWAFVLPIATAFLFKKLSSRRLKALRWTTTALVAYLACYNITLFIHYLVS